MSDLADLLEDPAVAAAVLRALMRDLTLQTKRNGAAVPEWAEPLLQGLQALAGGDVAEMSASGPAQSKVGPVSEYGLVSVAEAAAAGGVSERHVRRLARGPVVARRYGRDWRIDLDSLLSVLRRTA